MSALGAKRLAPLDVTLHKLPEHRSIVAPKGRYLYSSKWAVALIGAALLLVIVVGMVRELTERWRSDEEWTLDGG